VSVARIEENTESHKTRNHHLLARAVFYKLIRLNDGIHRDSISGDILTNRALSILNELSVNPNDQCHQLTDSFRLLECAPATDSATSASNPPCAIRLVPVSGVN